LAQRLALHGLLVQLQLASTFCLLLLTPNRPLALQHISPTLGRQCTLAALRSSSDVLPPCMSVLLCTLAVQSKFALALPNASWGQRRR
jgi:hypothetical protein